MIKGELPCQQLPQDQRVREHIRFHCVVGALGKYLWSHPPQILRSFLVKNRPDIRTLIKAELLQPVFQAAGWTTKPINPALNKNKLVRFNGLHSFQRALIRHISDLSRAAMVI